MTFPLPLGRFQPAYDGMAIAKPMSPIRHDDSEVLRPDAGMMELMSMLILSVVIGQRHAHLDCVPIA